MAEAARRADEYRTAAGSHNGAEHVVEEFVRQWALSLLLTEYGYPAEWVGGRIVIEEPVRMGSTSKEADISVKNTSGRTYLFIEVKRRGVSDDEFAEAERQLESYLAATHTATLGMVTDGDRVKVVRKKIEPNDFEQVTDLPAHGADVRVQTRLARSLPAGGDGRATGLTPLGGEFDRVLFQCHSAARDIDGLHADEALDELCKVLYCKIHDERSVVRQTEGAEFRFQTYGTANQSEAASEVRTLYDDARRADVELYAQRIPNYERSRGVFRQQIRLSDAALAQVVERLQRYSLVDSPADIKGKAFQSVLKPAIRAGMGQYFTPDPIVRLAVELVRPRPSDLILDPFCGSGHFLTKCLEYVERHQAGRISSRDLHEFRFFHLHGIEKSDRMARIAMTDMLLHDDGHTNVRNTDALLSFDNYPDLVALPDDDNQNPAVFDLVLTNPPFGSKLKREAIAQLGRFDLAADKKSVPLEVLGLERSLQFLKPGGRMAIVLPEHLLKGKSNRPVRDWLFRAAELKAVISFPEEAFTPYGAMVKTCLCVLRKLRRNERPDPSARAFLCDVENLGYDATGRDKPGSEVALAAAAFHEQVGW